MAEAPGDTKELVDEFRRHWQSATADSNLGLHGFRRFKTTHLLNLRFLESEIADLDHQIYQAGLSLNLSLSLNDRLGLQHSKRDKNVPKIDETINKDLVARLRDLLQRYDEAILAFNKIMAMETFSLLDDEKKSGTRSDLSLFEMYKTRLLRVDLESRSRVDPFQWQIRKYLRAFRYWRLSRKLQDNTEILRSLPVDHKSSYQNTILLANILSRFAVAVLTGSFLVVPLAILSQEQSKPLQLMVVSAFILAFAFLVATLLKASSLELMVVSAAYAAVLSVFVSNVTT